MDSVVIRANERHFLLINPSKVMLQAPILFIDYFLSSLLSDVAITIAKHGADSAVSCLYLSVVGSQAVSIKLSAASLRVNRGKNERGIFGNALIACQCSRVSHTIAVMLQEVCRIGDCHVELPVAQERVGQVVMDWLL